jgi:hypothetical protein
MVDPNQQMYNQQPMVDPNQQMYNQQPMVDPNQQMYAQQPMMDPNQQMYAQQPMMDPNQQMYNQQPMMDPNQQMMNPQQPMGAAPQQTISQEEHVEKPKKSIPILPILLILIVGVGGFFGYKFFFNNRMVVETEIKSVLKAADKGLDVLLKNSTNLDSSKEIIGYSGTLTIDSDYAANGIDLTKLKNYQIKYNGASDSKTNTSSLHATLYRAGMPFVDIKTLTKEDNAYMALGDIYGKVIKVDADTSIINANVDRTAQIKASKDLIERIQPIIIEYLDDSKITKTKEEIVIDGRSGKYNKISYTFNINETSKYLAEQCLKDEKIIEDIAIYLQKSTDDVKTLLEDAKNSSDATKDEVLIISAYKKTFSTKASKIDIVNYDNNSPEDKSIVELTFDKETTNFKISSATQELYNGTITDKELHMKNPEDTIALNAKFDDKNITGDMTISSNGVMLQADLESKNTDSNVKTTVNLNMSSGNETFNISFVNDMNVSADGKVEELDTTYAVTTDQISPEEQQYIYNQMQSKLQTLTSDLVTAQYRQTGSFSNLFNK